MNKLLSLYIAVVSISLQQTLVQGQFFITNVNIPSVTGGEMLLNRTVEISDGKIITISTHDGSAQG
ncbi:MAG: hypothetical protein HKN76_12185, partial [Saprospiraceae bacterium]|nr:hypothetical protein [Saprospiraceae bacterium]